MSIESRFHELDERPPSGAYLEGAWQVPWKDALLRSRQVAGFLASQGLSPGARLAISTRDEGEASILMLGCLRAGVAPLFIDPCAKPSEVGWLLAQAGGPAVLVDEDRIAAWGLDADSPLTVWPIARRGGGLLNRWLGKGASRDPDPAVRYPQCLASTPASSGPGDIPDEGAALILYTSGTTGGPKLVPLSRGNLVAQAEAMTAGLELDSQARVLNLMPLAHVDGLVTGAFLTMWLGSRTIRLERFSVGRVPEILDAVHKHRATHCVLVPTLLSLLVRLGEDSVFRAPEFKSLISTASAIPDQLWRDTEQATGKPVVNMYGMSEIGNVFFAGPADETRVVGTIGRAVGCESRVVDDMCNPVPPGEMGELVVRGPTVSAGYLGVKVPRPVIDGVEWFATGDLAIVGNHEVVRLVGRKKELIITGGNNVSPDEVNHVLLAHSAVKEVATFGVSDATWGERVVSCVVKEGEVEAADLMALAQENLSEFKAPREIHFLDSLPRGRTGKVQTDRLIEMLEAGDTESGRDLQSTVEEKVFRAAAQSFRLPDQDISMETSPQSCFTWDSMAHMDFAVRLEKALEVDLTPAEILRIDCVRTAVDLMLERVRERGP